MDRLAMSGVLATLGPLLLAQGKAVRRQTPILPVCGDAQGLEPGPGRPLRLGLLGDSIIAGVGVGSQAEGLSGRLAWHLARATSRPVEWRCVGLNGARARELLELELPSDFQPDLVVVSAGVNDVLRLTSKNAFRRHLETLGERWGRQPKVLAGIPDFTCFPSLPRPLKDVMAWRSRTLVNEARRLGSGWTVHGLLRPLRAEEFSPDLFHPGPRGCDAWARELAEVVSARL
ncbi:MAG: SGNH hydrolase [Candidatus Xenobia bacterium]